MIRIENRGVCYYQFEIFDRKVTQAIFTRRGGVSPHPWASLNLGGTVGDDPGCVLDNKIKALKSIGKEIATVFDVWQVHSTEVVITNSPRNTGNPHERADAILTDSPGVTLLMRFADCVPIYLFDPVCQVIGVAHAGWQGTINGIVPATIYAMQTSFGSKPKDILAGIGPSIGPDHYQVGEDVASLVRSKFEDEATALLKSENGKIFFDLWAANQLQLERTGIKSIEVANLCTACNTDDWYSHRAEHGKTGRFGAIFSLN